MQRLLLFAFLLLATGLSAQRTFRAGLHAGLNGCQIHGDNNAGFNLAQPVGGAFVSTDPTQKWYGQMELQYSGKGSRKPVNPDAGDYNTFMFRLSYVEAVFLARYNYKKLYFEFGETFGILARVRQWDAFGEVQPQGFRKWETACVFGVGVNLNENWHVDFRTTNSLLPVQKFPFPFTYPRFLPNLFNRGMYNNVVSLTLCYRFGGGSE